MTSVQERLKLKRVPIDTWSVKEQLCLASAVLRSGDQNWMSVSRSLRPFGEPSRPADWFSQKSCALQYGNLLENVETPKRKKRTDKTGNEHVETPGESIVRNLTHERINELKRILQEERATYLKLKEEVALIKAGQVDDRLADMCQQIEEEKKQKEKEAEAHAQWLRDRQEKKLELERAWKPPATSPLRKKLQRGTSGNRRNSSQSEPSSEAESAVDSPLSEQLNVDVIGDETNEAPVVEAKPVAPTPTSPLLTSLLKSPSPAPSAQSSILHSAITSAHHRPSTSSPTIASLLHSSPSVPPPTSVSPSLKNLVTSAIGAAASEESPKPVSSSPAAGAPTLSMLLELPPSLPGKPLPELPQPFPSTTTTTKPGEVCHPQHQEMRVRSEPGTDEPVEVVEVEQQVAREEKVEEAEVKVPAESDQTTPTSARASTPRQNHRINRKLFAEMEPSESEDVAAEVAEEMEVTTEEKPEEEIIKDEQQEDKEELPNQSEEQEIEAKKAEDEPESKQQENELAEEDIKMIMDMPVVMDSEIQETVTTEQTVTEVIEVPAAPAGDLDIFIMDSTSVANQEEVPVVTDIKLDDDEDEEEDEEQDQKEEAKANEAETKKQTKVATEESISNISENKSVESIVTVVNQGTNKQGSFEVVESSRIEVVAIEIPSSQLDSKVDDKDISFEDLEKDLYKEEEPKEDESDEKEASEVEKCEEDVIEAAAEETEEKDEEREDEEEKEEEAKDEKVDKEENVNTKEKDSVTEDEVKDKTETDKDEDKDADVKNDIKDEREVKDSEEKKDIQVEETSKIETASKSNEDSKEEKEQAKTVTEEPVDNVVKAKEDKKQEDETKEAPKEESGEEEEAEGQEEEAERQEEEAVQVTEIREEDKVASTETAAEQPSEAPSNSISNKTEEEEEEEEEKKEAEKSESEEVKSSPEKQKPAVTSLRAETPSTEDDKTNDAVEPPRAGPNRKRGTTSTPIDSVPNSPAAPMTDEEREYRTWKKAIMLVYGRLATHKYASLFLRPITDDQAPGYSSIVHRPIDLLTIKKNIETGVTRTTAEFQRDVMLMFLNSIMYNKSSYHVHDMAREMQREGMQHIQDFLTTQMLVQVSEVPLRRETRTTDAHKRGGGSSSGGGSGGSSSGGGGGGGGGGSGGEHLSTPGSSSQEETEALPNTPNNKRKRPDHDRSSTHKKRRGADSSRRHQHTEGDSSKQQTIDKYFKKQ